MLVEFVLTLTTRCTLKVSALMTELSFSFFHSKDIESKIAPLVCCPSELSEGASFYD